jgi:MFS family permease
MTRVTPDNPYNATFFACYCANTAMMVAVSVLFRYADFVYFLGGTEMELGLVVGLGMVGALSMRAFQAAGIDRFGPRIVWLSSIVVFVLSILAHVTVTRIDSPLVYLLRVLFTIGMAGAFGASITYVSLRVPRERMAEMIGVLGSSGFVGMALGPTFGDWLLAGGATERFEIDRMFYLAALAGTISFLCVILFTRREPVRVHRRTPPILWLLRRYHPGPLLMVSVAMGVGLGLPHIFLKAYAAELDISRIKTFFLVYAGAAFAVRLLTRRWVDRAGVRPVALVGLWTLSLSMLLYLGVWNELSLAIPAALSGVAHALLFPAVMSGGSMAFPSRYRGLATTVMLAMFDIGGLLGQPTVGGIINVTRGMGLPPYPCMFITVSAFLAIVALLYYRASLPKPGRTLLSKESDAPAAAGGSWPVGEPAEVALAQAELSDGDPQDSENDDVLVACQGQPTSTRER